MAKLRAVLTLLAQEQPLPAEYRDHALRGDWIGFRDLHIEPDWLLLYRIEGDEVQLARTGTHADLFRE
jgi:mRNA interferase YafQ